MEEKNKTNVEVKIDFPTIKVTLSTQVDLEKVDEIIEKLVDTTLKVNKKVLKIVDITEQKITQQPILTTQQQPIVSTDDPFNNVALRLDVDVNQLRNASLIGIKNNKVQIFKPQKFSPQEAILVLTFVYESGLKMSSVNYDILKETYQDSGIKGNTPFRMAITNVKNLGYIDKQKYDNNQEVVLSPKGADKAAVYIKKALGSNSS